MQPSNSKISLPLLFGNKPQPYGNNDGSGLSLSFEKADDTKLTNSEADLFLKLAKAESKKKSSGAYDSYFQHFFNRSFGKGVTGYGVVATLIAIEEKESKGLSRWTKGVRLLRGVKPSFVPIRKIAKTTYSSGNYKNVYKALETMFEDGYLRYWWDPITANTCVQFKGDKDIIKSLLTKYAPETIN